MISIQSNRQETGDYQCRVAGKLFDLRLENLPGAFPAHPLHPGLTHVGGLCHQRFG